MTNYTLKSAASVSNALGSVVVSYSIFHALLSLAGGTRSLLTINFHFPDLLLIAFQMIMSGCLTKRSLAYPEHSQALCSNQLVARSSAWKYVNHQSTLNIPHVLPAFFNKIGFFVGWALKKLKLCCHFLSWKSSERRNNLSYISVTYPGSAGW